jgi:hypothetical protein
MPGLDKPLGVRKLFADCTWLESNIHFAVDWVLLWDAVRTLVQAIKVIRGSHTDLTEAGVAQALGHIDGVLALLPAAVEQVRERMLGGRKANNILPPSPRLMAEALEDESSRAAQKRRAQTAGRIGIVKNVFIGDTLSGKGYRLKK